MKIPFFGRSQDLSDFGSFLVAALAIFGAALNISGQETTVGQQVSVKQAQTESKIDKKSSIDQGKIKVVFDENSPGIVIIESNGEKIRVDTSKKTVQQLASNEEKGVKPDAETAKAKITAQQEKEESSYDFDRGEEPSDSAWR